MFKDLDEGKTYSCETNYTIKECVREIIHYSEKMRDCKWYEFFKREAYRDKYSLWVTRLLIKVL